MQQINIEINATNLHRNGFPRMDFREWIPERSKARCSETRHTVALQMELCFKVGIDKAKNESRQVAENVSDTLFD